MPTEVPAAPAGGGGSLAFLSGSPHLPHRLRRGLAAFALGQTAWGGVKAVRGWHAERTSYTVSLTEDDDVYPEIHSWVLAHLPDRDRRAVVARSTRRNGDEVVPVDAAVETGAGRRITFFYDGARRQTVEIGGHRVDVHVERPDSVGDHPMPWQKEKIVFTAQSVAGRDALITFLEGVASAVVERPPRLYVASRWSGWNRQEEGPRRTLASVVLRAGQLERIVDDLADFLRREQDYARLGVPWHRGYLFAGVPGTGKTSVARALASHFHLDAYFIPLSSVENDGSLIQLLNSVQPRSLLLLEDVDVVHAARVRDDGESGITMAGLLNVLDGVATPHGVVTVLTTNNDSLLDPALLRPGRVDRRETFLPLDDEQLDRLVATFLGHDWPVLLAEDVRLTPAEAIEAVKQHLGDPDAGRYALSRLACGLPRPALDLES